MGTKGKSNRPHCSLVVQAAQQAASKNTKDGKLLLGQLPHQGALTEAPHKAPDKAERSSCHGAGGRVGLGVCAGARGGSALRSTGRLWAGAGQLLAAGHLLSPGAGGEAREGRGTA